jgi:Mediator of RNA polymerase II transcription subunit 1
MATPSKTPATSTPKTNNLTPTSVRKMASPRPVTAGKTLSYKSPMAAMKTPASANSHNISTSSQPSNTPLLAHTFTEGAVNLDSPSAALMGFSNSHGLTPLPSGLDGLGLQTMPARHATDVLARNPEADKLQRLQDMASLLKTRATGRGVTRDGVVRIAQLSGFTTYWDEDLLTVAGNLVDLEIMFDGLQKDAVKDVVLKISASGSEERQEEASAILRRDLDLFSEGTTQQPWSTLHYFAENISRLRQLDKFSDGVNCFEAVDGLYDAFRQVWEEEMKRLTWRSEFHHVSGGTVGRARMNKTRRLGVALDYWIGRHELEEGKALDECNHLPATNIETMDEDFLESQEVCWTALISCKAGFPSLRVSKDWLSPEILTIDNRSAEGHMQDMQLLRPAWNLKDLPVHSLSVSKDENDQMKIDGGNAGATPTPDAHFTFTLDPLVYLPASSIQSLVEQGLMISSDPSKVVEYREVLAPAPSSRWLRSIDTYNSDGIRKNRQQSYELLPSNLGYYPVSTVGFSHPSQLADLLPMLRQHALLWSILRKLVPSPASVDDQPLIKESRYVPGQKLKSNTVQKRSNVTQPAKLYSSKDQSNASKVEVTLSSSGSLPLLKPKLELRVPLHNGSSNRKRFCYTSFEIEENGNPRMLLTEIPDMDPQRANTMAGKILALSEDLGVLVEWMLEKASG